MKKERSAINQRYFMVKFKRNKIAEENPVKLFVFVHKTCKKTVMR